MLEGINNAPGPRELEEGEEEYVHRLARGRVQ